MTKLGLGILLLAIGCMATAANTSSFESALAQGTQLLEEEEYADAAEVLDEAIDSLRAERGGSAIPLDNKSSNGLHIVIFGCHKS